MAFIARLGGVNSFDIAYSDSDLESEFAGLDKLFASHLPLRMDIDCSQCFIEILKAVKEQVESVRKHASYTRDLIARYPELRSIGESGGKFTLPLVVERVERLNDRDMPAGSEILLKISENALQCRWIFDGNKLVETTALWLRSHFNTFVRGMVADPTQPIGFSPQLTHQHLSRIL